MLTINRLCCMRLHTAGVVIGWLGAAACAIGIVIYAVILSNLDEIIKSITDNQPSNSTINPEALKASVVIVLSIYITLSLVNLISSVLLIAGTMKERHLMLVPWLINGALGLLASVFNCIYVVWASIAAEMPFAGVVALLIFMGVCLSIHYLIWTAVYSLFRHIRSMREQEQLIPNKAGTAYPSYTRI